MVVSCRVITSQQKSHFTPDTEQSFVNTTQKCVRTGGVGKRFMYGYKIKNEEKVYDTLNHKTVFLITFLRQGLASSICMRQHFKASLISIISSITLRDRTYQEMTCVIKGWRQDFFWYSFLELTSRYQIHPKLKSGKIKLKF